MPKIIDGNGYWFIKHNPLSKEGVFPYLGKTISDECIPDKIYNVYRPASTLRESVPTWDNPPKVILLGHQMLGTGFMSPDDEKVRGVVTNPSFDEDTGVLYGDITIYSDELKSAIQNGTKEISLGYFCKYEKEPGVFNGQVYDYVQRDMQGNHVAVVENGRCGSDVKVFDHQCTMDSVDINPTDFQAKDGTSENLLNKNPDSVKIDNKEETLTTDNTEEKMADKREFIRKIMAIAAKADSDFEGGESEKIETIAKLLEESEYAKSEDNDDVEEKETTDKCGKDEDDKEDKKTNTTEDEDDEEEKKDKAEDADVVSASEIMAWLKTISEQLTALTSKSTKDEDVDEEKKDAEDEDEEKKDSEDEDEEKKDEKKTSEDSAVFVFGKTAQGAAEDPALKAYLA